MILVPKELGDGALAEFSLLIGCFCGHDSGLQSGSIVPILVPLAAEPALVGERDDLAAPFGVPGRQS